MKSRANPYDLFMINLRMIETMIKEARSKMNNDEGLHMQISLLQGLISGLTKLQKELKEIAPKKHQN